MAHRKNNAYPKKKQLNCTLSSNWLGLERRFYVKWTIMAVHANMNYTMLWRQYYATN